MIQDLFNTLIKNKLTPNGLFVLSSIRDSVNPIIVNVNLELRLLQYDKWIDNDNKLTTKAVEFLDFIDNSYTVKLKRVQKIILGKDAAEYINQYRELFPKGKLPSGISSRVTPQELEKKFTWFFNTYKNITWETIIEVTRRYVEEYEHSGYMYMKNSSYFIFKQDQNKVITSELATRCLEYLESDDEPDNEQYSQRIIRKNK